MRNPDVMAKYIAYVIQLVIVGKCSVKKHVRVFNKVVTNFVGPFLPK